MKVVSMEWNVNQRCFSSGSGNIRTIPLIRPAPIDDDDEEEDESSSDMDGEEGEIMYCKSHSEDG